MAVLVRLLILFTLALAIGSAQCETICAVGKCSKASGHCHQKSPTPCSHVHTVSHAAELSTHADIALAPQLSPYSDPADAPETLTLLLPVDSDSPPLPKPVTLRI